MSFVWILLGLFLAALAAASAASNVTGRVLGQGRKDIRVPLGMAVLQSTKSFDETYTALTAMLNNNPNIRVMGEVDHSFAAAQANLELLPNKVILFGNPSLGTPLMLQDPKAALDLPQKMLIWQNDQKVYIGYNTVDYLEVRYPEIEGTPQLDIIASALANLAAGAAGLEVEEALEQATMTRREKRYMGCEDTFRSMKSDFDFNTTLHRLIRAIEASPADLLFQVDHAANAAAINVTMRPCNLLIFGNPQLGTRFMQAGPTTGIDLPLKMLVHENKDGEVMVTANAPFFLRVRHGLRQVGPPEETLRMVTFNFLEEATDDED